MPVPQGSSFFQPYLRETARKSSQNVRSLATAAAVSADAGSDMINGLDAIGFALAGAPANETRGHEIAISKIASIVFMLSGAPCLPFDPTMRPPPLGGD